MLHGIYSFESCFFLSTLALRIEMSVILTFFNTRDLYSRCAGTPNQTDSDITFSRSCDERNITKKGPKDNYGRLIDFMSPISTC